ncbi:vesicle-associated protein 1-4 [Arabidopsis lyrata subsp. lyrata]|uniref:vesicle-associated protein 1-4 n=1 Tax=Arabidopsis lyrata subsp. lyrata TaxID=81972 RepID=UPI000A29D6A5|nr:vesicle-associated protein 1-4 [Arabidopsis lyrata subsp. lyrata]|eukprot:XP_020887724.1 vesicle-associated protein 1-4 [Arabidopsis lyrata subsp. lyrata]
MTLGAKTFTKKCHTKQKRERAIKILRSTTIPLPMAVSSFSDEEIPPQHQVFINYRGDELRKSFLGFLVKAMRDANINVFTDEIEVKVKMKERNDQDKLVVIPIFYRLDANNCKRLEGPFGDNFRKLEREYRSEPERIKKWKEALIYIPQKIGLTSAGHRYYNSFRLLHLGFREKNSCQ